MQPIYSEAKAFIDTMYDHEVLTFQTASKNRDVIKPTYRHGTLDQQWDWLCEQNALGANIYIMVNEGDGKGRKLRNVRAVTSVLVDLDGAPVEPLLQCSFKPHVVTETSEGRFQGLWKIDRIQVTRSNRYEVDQKYKRVHSGIAKKFDADPSQKGLSHVCRLPGFINHNHKPFISRVFERFPIIQASMDGFTDTMELDLSQPAVQPYKPLVDGNGVPVNLTSGDPIQQKLRNETLLRICFSLARDGIVGDELANHALEINAARCVPPLESDEVIGIARKVTRHFSKITDERITTNIVDYNTGLRVHNGQFYRFDPETREYRMIDLTALRTRIYRESKFTANDDRIKHVLQGLYDSTRECESLSNPESRFIEERLRPGGKAVLRSIFAEYKSWCENRQTKPVSQPCLRKEIERAHPGTYRRDIRTGNTRHHGFLGISLTEDISESESDGIPLDFTYNPQR